MLKIETFLVGDYQVNAALVWCDRTRQAVLFDPGADADSLIEEIESRALTLTALVNTHGHLDHIGGNREIKEHFGVPLYIHAADRPMLTNAARNLSVMTGDPVTSPDADATLDQGDELKVGTETLQVLHVPGHTPGSLCFYYPGWVVCGDTLFAGGIGRGDLPGGDESRLMQAIRTRLYALPDNTVVYPGHGPSTTIGEEKRSNPFVRA